MIVLNKITLSAKQQLIILILLAIGLNMNTLFNEYAVDDVVVLTENTLVNQGIKGIPEILSSDLFAGFKKTGDGLSEARYRPFSLVIFALEVQFFGLNPFVSHLINVLLFVLLTFLLYKLLRSYMFREQHANMAFITCLLFVAHPIHTEVIANVKSRDELLAFSLIIASLITIIIHTEKRSPGLFLSGLVCFFLALLTRESAVTFVAVLPLILYFFFKQSIKKSLQFTLPLIAVLAVYLVLRYTVIGFPQNNPSDVLNTPFLYATASEAFATKIFILFKYIALLFFPHPLSCDYGYNQIPYVDINSIPFILSLIALLVLISYAIYMFKSRSISSFCILYFMLSISLVANFVMDIGTPLSERLLFQPSLAFCILVSSFYFKVEKHTKIAGTTILLILILLFSAKTIIRNQQWKNNETLYFSDVNSAPNSVRVNLYAAQQYILKAKVEPNSKLKNEYLKKAVYYGERSLKIYPKYPITYMDLGVAYFGLLDYFKTADLWMQAYHLNPSNPEAKENTEMLSTILFNEGNKFYEKGNINHAIQCYLKSVELNEKKVEAWYNLGGNLFLINDTKNAIEAWQHVLILDPNHPMNRESFSIN